MDEKRKALNLQGRLPRVISLTLDEYTTTMVKKQNGLRDDATAGAVGFSVNFKRTLSRGGRLILGSVRGDGEERSEEIH